MRQERRKKEGPDSPLQLAIISLTLIVSLILARKYVKSFFSYNSRNIASADIHLPNDTRIETRRDTQPKSTFAPQTPSREEIEREIETVFAPAGAKNVATAKRIVGCESGYNPMAENKGNYGLFQINWVHRYPKATLLNWKKNIKIAYTIFEKNNGWGPWEPYSGHCWKITE